MRISRNWLTAALAGAILAVGGCGEDDVDRGVDRATDEASEAAKDAKKAGKKAAGDAEDAAKKAEDEVDGY
jgi:hypothetical protein